MIVVMTGRPRYLGNDIIQAKARTLKKIKNKNRNKNKNKNRNKNKNKNRNKNKNTIQNPKSK